MNRLTLYNAAIAHAGGSPIIASDSPGQATVCNDYIDTVVDSTLERHDFTFARAREPLTVALTREDQYSEYSAQTLGDFDYSYSLPKDFLQMRSVIDHEVGEWKIYGDYLGSDNEDVEIDYTLKLRNIETLPSIFAEALAYYLAYYIAPRISGHDVKRQQMLYSQYEFFLEKAILSDKKKEFISTPGEYEWVDV